MQNCLVCESPFEEFINFGPTPIANGFLMPEDFGDEYFFDLRVGFCPTCSMVQLLEQPDREQMFHDQYAYFSSISTRMSVHFEKFANQVKEKYLSDTDPFVVEIGSNDGIMLRHFADAGIPHLGVEPSANVAEIARGKGIETLCEFFDKDVAGKIRAERGQADAILSANCMCHIPYLHSLADGVADLLKPKGVLIFQDPYLGDIVEKTSYDQIYDEHVFFFSLLSVQNLFSRHGLEVIDVQHEDVHGGSMRYFLAKKGAREISSAVADLAKKEAALGLAEAETFDIFRKNVEQSKADLMEALESLKAEGKRVVGYGATSKSTTVTNYCGISPDLVSFISDTTPTKQDKFSPGVHIPVKPYDAFAQDYPDVALLFAWNHGEEIIAREGAFKEAGGQWLTYVPKVSLA